MNIYLLKGKGHFTDNEGKEVIYPITKLCCQNENGEEIQLKVDKINKLLLPYLFNIESSNQLVEDDAGNELEIFYLKEKSAQNKRIVVE